MDFWRTKKFKTLSSEWNRKLEASGFVDAEVESGGDRLLKQRSSNSYRQADPLERESRLEYYVFLGHLAHTTKFPNDLEFYVMHRHAEGATIKEIVAEIALKGISRDRKTIRFIIRRWQTKWGIRRWTLQQMNLKKLIK